MFQLVITDTDNVQCSFTWATKGVLIATLDAEPEHRLQAWPQCKMHTRCCLTHFSFALPLIFPGLTSMCSVIVCWLKLLETLCILAQLLECCLSYFVFLETTHTSESVKQVWQSGLWLFKMALGTHCGLIVEVKSLSIFPRTVLMLFCTSLRLVVICSSWFVLEYPQPPPLLLLWHISEDVVGSAWSFGLLHQRPITSDFEGFSFPDCIHYIYFPILIIEIEPVFCYFPFWMFSAKQGHYWYHLYNVFGMTRSLTGDWTWDLPHSKPALYH